MKLFLSAEPKTYRDWRVVPQDVRAMIKVAVIHHGKAAVQAATKAATNLQAQFNALRPLVPAFGPGMMSARTYTPIGEKPTRATTPAKVTPTATMQKPVQPASVTPKVEAPKVNPVLERYAQPVMSRANFNKLNDAQKAQFCVQHGGKVVDQMELGKKEFQFAEPEKITRAEFSKLSPRNQGDFLRRGGKLTDK